VIALRNGEKIFSGTDVVRFGSQYVPLAIATKVMWAAVASFHLKFVAGGLFRARGSKFSSPLIGIQRMVNASTVQV